MRATPIPSTAFPWQASVALTTATEATSRPPGSTRPALGRSADWTTHGLQLTAIVALLLGWQLVADTFDTDFWTSSPLDIVELIWQWARTGTLWDALAVTMAETLIGFVLGAAAGSVVGFVLGWYRILGDAFEPIIMPFYALPKVALAPLFVLLFGIGIGAKGVMLVALMVFFITFFTTFKGTRGVDRDLIVVARMMGASRVDTWRSIALPHASVWMLSGLRLALPSAFHGAVVGEFIAASAGIGFLIRKSTATFNTTESSPVCSSCWSSRVSCWPV